jgi:phthalate 4,5-dioxygenase oxygenase subunit
MIDRQVQKTSVYAGIPFGAHTQDACVTESMGPISDRENEHLGACDLEPIAMRKMLLQVVRDVQAGKDPPGVAFTPEDNRFPLDLVHATIPLDTPWQDVDAVRATMLYSGPPPKRVGVGA